MGILRSIASGVAKAGKATGSVVHNTAVGVKHHMGMVLGIGGGAAGFIVAGPAGAIAGAAGGAAIGREMNEDERAEEDAARERAEAEREEAERNADESKDDENPRTVAPYPSPRE